MVVRGSVLQGTDPLGDSSLDVRSPPLPSAAKKKDTEADAAKKDADEKKRQEAARREAAMLREMQAAVAAQDEFNESIVSRFRRWRLTYAAAPKNADENEKKTAPLLTERGESEDMEDYASAPAAAPEATRQEDEDSRAVK